MTYTAPTAAEFKVRFPVFDNVDDAVVSAVIIEAADHVSEKWIEKHFQMAQMLFTAHTLTLDGHGDTAQAEFASIGDFTKIKSGDLEVSKASSSNDGKSAISSTSYGRRFLELRRVSFPGLMVF